MIQKGENKDLINKIAAVTSRAQKGKLQNYSLYLICIIDRLFLIIIKPDMGFRQCNGTRKTHIYYRVITLIEHYTRCHRTI